MPQGDVALLYAQRPDELLIWKVTRQGVVAWRRPLSSAVLEQRVSAFSAKLRSGRVDKSAAAALGRDLLPAELNPSPANTIAIFPDGGLNALPFALIVNPQSGRALVQDFIPVVGQSLTVWRMDSMRASTKPSSTLLIGYGAAQPALGLPPLPAAAAEIEAIARVAGANARRLEGPETTREALLREMPRHSVIHFAGHAVIDETYADRSRLFVAESDSGDTLTPADVGALRLRTGTVVMLSACEGARGRVLRGEGSLNWARPFLAAGASSVVANLWPVRDGIDSQIAIAVHRRMAAGSSVAVALALEQRTAIEAGTSASAWAGWIVMGKA
jgi:CHAT domain-containing protein